MSSCSSPEKFYFIHSIDDFWLNFFPFVVSYGIKVSRILSLTRSYSSKSICRFILYVENNQLESLWRGKESGWWWKFSINSFHAVRTMNSIKVERWNGHYIFLHLPVALSGTWNDYNLMMWHGSNKYCFLEHHNGDFSHSNDLFRTFLMTFFLFNL